MNALKTAGIALLAVFAGMLLGASIHAKNPVSDTKSATAPLPKDIYPESGNRLPYPKREDMDDYGKRIFDEQTGPRLSWTKQVPLRLYSPRLAKPMSDAHQYLKFQTGLGDRLTEIAVLVTSREMDNQFEWTQWKRMRVWMVLAISSSPPSTSLNTTSRSQVWARRKPLSLILDGSWSVRDEFPPRLSLTLCAYLAPAEWWI